MIPTFPIHHTLCRMDGNSPRNLIVYIRVALITPRKRGVLFDAETY